MRIKQLVEQMGGVHRFTSEPLAPMPRELMSKYLDITREEFADYLDYLEVFGAETALTKEYSFTPYSTLPEYCHPYPDGDAPFMLNVEMSGGDFGFFNGEGPEYRDDSLISNHLQVYRDRIPDHFIPIAANVFGDLICLCTQGERIGQIFYWNHESEWDEEDYLEEYGVPMPEEVKMQNVYLIGKNLYDCFERMTPEEV